METPQDVVEKIKDAIEEYWTPKLTETCVQLGIDPSEIDIKSMVRNVSIPFMCSFTYDEKNDKIKIVDTHSVLISCLLLALIDLIGYIDTDIQYGVLKWRYVPFGWIWQRHQAPVDRSKHL